jgi:hypothetical protein
MRFLFLVLGGWSVYLACAASAPALELNPASAESVMLTREAMQYRRNRTEVAPGKTTDVVEAHC